LVDRSGGGIAVQAVVYPLPGSLRFDSVKLESFFFSDGWPSIDKSEQALGLVPLEVVEKTGAIRKYQQARFTSGSNGVDPCNASLSVGSVHVLPQGGLIVIDLVASGAPEDRAIVGVGIGSVESA